jgi:hypothetical protein
VKAKSVELIRESIKVVVRSREYAVDDARRQTEYREDAMKNGRNQGAKTRATNERAVRVEELAKKEAKHAEAAEALREFNEEHPS